MERLIFYNPFIKDIQKVHLELATRRVVLEKNDKKSSEYDKLGFELVESKKEREFLEVVFEIICSNLTYLVQDIKMLYYNSCNCTRRGIIMLTKLEIELEKKEELFMNYNNGSLFHGALMEMIDTNYASILHEGSVRPYCQYIEVNNDKVLWHINTFTKEAYDNIIETLMKDDVAFVLLRKKSIRLNIESKKIENSTMESFMKKYYLNDSERYITLAFKTPTSFKSYGKYMIYPTTKNIYESLIKKFDDNSKEAIIYDEEIIEQLIENSEIIRYNLRSTVFHLEGVKIPSFIGEITLKVSGPQAMVNLVNMLARFSEYSGIGIKCTLGMGAVRVIERKQSGKEKQDG